MADEREVERWRTYEPGSVERLTDELLTVRSSLARWSHGLILVGGLAAPLLVASAGGAIADYVGTHDLDLCIDATIWTRGEPVFRQLGSRLRSAGYAPVTRRSWAWRRESTNTGTQFFVRSVAGLVPGRVLSVDSARSDSAAFGAMTLWAGEYVEADFSPRSADSLGLESVPIAGALAQLVLKGVALGSPGRDNPKDAYDVIWLLARFPGGPSAVVQAVAESRLAAVPQTRLVLDKLITEFRRKAGRGSAGWQRFSEFYDLPADLDMATVIDEFDDALRSSM